jgi:hypothetical protein
VEISRKEHRPGARITQPKMAGGWQEKAIDDFLKGDPLWAAFLDRIRFEERAEHEKRRLVLLERLKKKFKGPSGRVPDIGGGQAEITLDLRKRPSEAEYANSYTAGVLRIVGFSSFTTKEELVGHLKREELWPSVRRVVMVPWEWPVAGFEIFISNSRDLELDLWYKHADDNLYIHDPNDERFFVQMLPKKLARAVQLRSTDLLKAARERRLWKVLQTDARAARPVALHPLYEAYRTLDYMAYKAKRLCMLVQAIDNDLPRRISLLSFLSPRVTVIVLGGLQLHALFALQRLWTLQKGAQLVLFEPLNARPITKCEIHDIGGQLERLERTEEAFLCNLANAGTFEYTGRRIALARFKKVRALAQQKKDVSDRELGAVDILPDNTNLLQDETD